MNAERQVKVRSADRLRVDLRDRYARRRLSGRSDVKFGAHRLRLYSRQHCRQSLGRFARLVGRSDLATNMQAWLGLSPFAPERKLAA